MITRYYLKGPIAALIYLGDCSAATCEELVRTKVSRTSFLRHYTITCIAIEQAKKAAKRSRVDYSSCIAQVESRLNDAVAVYKQKHPNESVYQI